MKLNMYAEITMIPCICTGRVENEKSGFSKKQKKGFESVKIIEFCKSVPKSLIAPRGIWFGACLK